MPFVSALRFVTSAKDFSEKKSGTAFTGKGSGNLLCTSHFLPVIIMDHQAQGLGVDRQLQAVGISGLNQHVLDMAFDGIYRYTIAFGYLFV